MKYLLILLVALGASQAAPKNSPTTLALLDDLLDFVALLPLDDIIAINQDHIAVDPAVNAVIAFLQTDEWHDAVTELRRLPFAEDLDEWITNAGVPVDLIIDGLITVVDGITPGTDPDATGSLRPFLDHIESVLPFDDLNALLEDKLANSEDFQDFYIEISSEDNRDLVNTILENDQVAQLRDQLRNQEAGIDELLQVIYDAFGWGDVPNKK